MRFLHSYLVYFSILLVLWGWCSSFQRPARSSYVQTRWEWAQQHRALDSLLFYQSRLQAQWSAAGKEKIVQEQNRQFLAFVLHSEQLDGSAKRALLSQYPSTQAWNYAYKVQWHSQYGTLDSAYFYQSLLENMPAPQVALLYAYGQLALNFGLRQQKYREVDLYLRLAEALTSSASDSLLLYPIQLKVYAAFGQLERATTAGLALARRQRNERKVDSVALAATLGVLGELYQQQGDYQRATIYTGEALNYLADRTGYSNTIGKYWLQLATAYFHSENKPLETILYGRNALAKWREVAAERMPATSYIDVYQLLSQQFLDVQQLDSSQTYLDKARRLQKDNFYKIAEGHAIQAALYQRIGKDAAATSALKKALEATQIATGSKGEATAQRYLVLGQQYQAQKQWTHARQVLTEALWALSWQPRRRALPASSSLLSMRLALVIGNAQVKTLLELQEQSKYAVSREVIEEQISYNLALVQVLQEQQPWEGVLWQQAKQARQQAVEWSWQRFNKTSNPILLEEGWAQAEANRQAVVREQLQRHWEQNPNRALVELQKTLRREYRQQHWYEARIWMAYQQNDSSQLDWYRQQLAANKASLTLARQRLENQHQTTYQWAYQERPLDIDSLQKRLKKGDALLQYLEGEDVVYQFVVTKDTLLMRRIVWEDYQTTLLKYGRHFTNPRMRQYLRSGGFQDFCRTGHSLYYRLVHHDLFKTIQRLIIIPDGLLQELPFESLLTEIPLDSVHRANFAKLDYLLKSKRIHYHYSSRLWWDSWQRPRTAINKEVLALGASYGGSQEVSKKAVQRQLRQQLDAQTYMQGLTDSLSNYYAGDFYTNRYASEYYYKDYSSKYGLLYLGLYGYNGTASDDLPSLVLAEDGYAKEDNFLSFYEIQAQPLLADLVFLGNVYDSQSRDLMVLGSSFLYAGSKSVVLPLWQQDSTAVAVTRYYYDGLQQGLENDEALRQAKLKYLRTASSEAVHPSYWAGYILLGNQQVIQVAAPIAYIWWFVLPIAFICLLGWWSLQALRQKR